MAKEARSVIKIRAFQGMTTDADPHDLPPGLARESINCESQDPGVLRSRKGYRQATFESGEGSGTSAYSSMVFYMTPHANFVVGQLTNGTEYFLRNPSI